MEYFASAKLYKKKLYAKLNQQQNKTKTNKQTDVRKKLINIENYEIKFSQKM